MATGQLFYDPLPRPQPLGVALPLGVYNFYASGTTSPLAVYQDAALTAPYPVNSSGQYTATADGNGVFPQIFMQPAQIYRVQLYNAAGQLLEDVDPYVPAMPTTGNGLMTFNVQGEITIQQPNPGGTGVTLTIVPPTGGKSLLISGSSAGAAAMIVNNAVTIGTQTATFTATNKPGSGTTAPTKWLPIQCDGATYYTPLWL